MGGKIDKAKGRVKKATGDLTENQSLKEKGHVDKAKGKTKSGVDKAAKKVKRGIKRVG
jgi:uncharacterized protein YjbJ (UPF0337 family)